MNIKRNIIFSLESRKKDGKPILKNVPIRMRVIYDSKRIEFTTGYRIDVSKWDNNKQRVKNGCTNILKQTASEINTDLLTYNSIIQSIFKEYEVLGEIPTPRELKNAFNSKINIKNNNNKEDLNNTSFFKIFDMFVQESGKQNSWSKATFAKFKTVRQHLLDFDFDLSFDSLDENKLNDYIYFLGNIKKLRNTTVIKQIGFLKWFLRWTFKKGYNKNNAFQYFNPKPKTTQKRIIFLTWDELMHLYNFDVPESKSYLDRVRDVFLFCCFTSLRYSDVYNLKSSDVKETHIEVTTVKTGDDLIIELNKYSKSILEKYKDVHFSNDKVLPVISNQKMNDYLKELGELAGIDDPIRETYYKGNKRIDEVYPKYALLSTHAGRRTFICNALSLGIPAQVVMKWTGHSDYKAMKPYIDIADDIKASAMSKFDKE